MARHVYLKLTVAQAQAACNATDLIRDQYEADGDRREASLYERTSNSIDQQIKEQTNASR